MRPTTTSPALGRSRSPASTRPIPSCSRSCSRSSPGRPRGRVHHGRRARGLRGGVRRLLRDRARRRRVLRHRGDRRSRCARSASAPATRSIVPTNSFIATAEAVSLAGATPQLVDVDPRTHLITADARRGGDRPAHALRDPRPPDGRRRSTWTRSSRSPAPPDRGRSRTCAQAHGARYDGRRVGTIGDIGCFSFYPTKNLGGWGDGGAVVTADAELAERVRLLRSHGEQPRYHHRIVGTTARLDALQAALLRVKLRRLDGWNEDRRRLGAALREGLEGTSVELPAPACADGDHVYHLFIVRSQQRDALRALPRAARRRDRGALPVPDPPHRGLRGPRPRRGQPAGRPSGWREEICTLPLFPSMSERRSRAGHRGSPGLRPGGDMSVHQHPAGHGRASRAATRPASSGSPWSATATGGPNLVRNVIERPELELAALCERDEARAAAFTQRVPGVPVYGDLDEVLADPAIDAVVVATPPRTHHRLVRAALDGRQARARREAAGQDGGRGGRPDRARGGARPRADARPHVPLQPAGQQGAGPDPQDQLGEVYFVTSSRMNLGKYQSDGVICDLAPHDLSILLYLLDQPVAQVSTSARSVFQEGIPEVAFLALTFANGVTGERPDLVARSAQGARDGHRRQPADGPVRRHRRRRAGARLRSRHGLQGADELRRASAQLSQRRHRDPACRCRRAAEPRARRLRACGQHRRHTALPRPARATRSST